MNFEDYSIITAPHIIKPRDWCADIRPRDGGANCLIPRYFEARTTAIAAAAITVVDGAMLLGHLFNRDIPAGTLFLAPAAIWVLVLVMCCLRQHIAVSSRSTLKALATKMFSESIDVPLLVEQGRIDEYRPLVIGSCIVLIDEDHGVTPLAFARMPEAGAQHKQVFESAGLRVDSAESPVLLLRTATRWF